MITNQKSVSALDENQSSTSSVISQPTDEVPTTTPAVITGSTKLSYDHDSSLQFDPKLPGIVADAVWKRLRDEIGSKAKYQQKSKLVEEAMQDKTFGELNSKTHFDTNSRDPSSIKSSFDAETELDQSESQHLFCKVATDHRFMSIL